MKRAVITWLGHGFPALDNKEVGISVNATFRDTFYDDTFRAAQPRIADVKRYHWPH